LKSCVGLQTRRPHPCDIMSSMAVPANQSLEIRVPPGLEEPLQTAGGPNGEFVVQMSDVQKAAARLYGLTYTRRQIVEILLEHLAGTHKTDGTLRTRRDRERVARAKLRKWEKKQEFRDLIWDSAVVSLDMDTPAILAGVAQKAKRGRVDAARLALEVTGRHNPRGDAQPTEIHVQIANIPRPD
jgi:hypothetical protein